MRSFIWALTTFEKILVGTKDFPSSNVIHTHEDIKEMMQNLKRNHAAKGALSFDICTALPALWEAIEKRTIDGKQNPFAKSAFGNKNFFFASL